MISAEEIKAHEQAIKDAEQEIFLAKQQGKFTLEASHEVMKMKIMLNKVKRLAGIAC